MWESLLRIALKCSEEMPATAEIEDEAVRTHTHTHAVYNIPDAPFLVQAAKETLELIAAVCTFVQGVLCMDKPPLHATALLDTLGVLHGRRKKLTEEANLAFKFNY